MLMNYMPWIIFGLTGLAFLFIFGKLLATWFYNNAQPVLEMDAEIILKRNEVKHRQSYDGNDHRSYRSRTYYYVTFEMNDGERKEFHITGGEFGLLKEGDQGRLRFQGTRYHNFSRVA